jgi:hypothetical protein
MAFTKYGHTFQDEKAMNAYGKMKSESRSRALKHRTSDDNEKAEIRKHFKGEAKHFNLK